MSNHQILQKSKSASNTKGNFALLGMVLGIGLLKAENQLASTINNSSTSALQEAIKLGGNIGAGIAILAVVLIFIGAIWDSERLKNHTTKLIVAVVGGGIVKALCSVSISANLFG